MKLLKDTNDEWLKSYIEQAENFIEHTKAPFNKIHTNTYIIVEFLANKDGFTIYKSVADEE